MELLKAWINSWISRLLMLHKLPKYFFVHFINKIFKEGDQFFKIPELFIRGNSIKYIRMVSKKIFKNVMRIFIGWFFNRKSTVRANEK